MDGRKTKWLEIRKVPSKKPDKKTNVYHVLATYSGEVRLGEIKWFGKWRRYAFFPASDTVYEPTCMRDISQFLDDLANERRMSRQFNLMCERCTNNFKDCAACKKAHGML